MSIIYIEENLITMNEIKSKISSINKIDIIKSKILITDIIRCIEVDIKLDYIIKYNSVKLFKDELTAYLISDIIEILSDEYTFLESKDRLELKSLVKVSDEEWLLVIQNSMPEETVEIINN